MTAFEQDQILGLTVAEQEQLERFVFEIKRRKIQSLVIFLFELHRPLYSMLGLILDAFGPIFSALIGAGSVQLWREIMSDSRKMDFIIKELR